MKSMTIKGKVTNKVENPNNGQIRLVAGETKNKPGQAPSLPECSITLVFSDPKRVTEFEINKIYSFTIKPE